MSIAKRGAFIVHRSRNENNRSPVRRDREITDASLRGNDHKLGNGWGRQAMQIRDHAECQGERYEYCKGTGC